MEITISWGLIMAMIIGLVEIGKKIGLPDKFCPLLALVLGIGFALLLPGLSTTSIIFGGIVVGLSAVGLFSTVKNTVEGIKGK